MHDGAAVANPVNVGVVGAGRIGTSHAELLGRRVPGARLLAVADHVRAQPIGWRRD